MANKIPYIKKGVSDMRVSTIAARDLEYYLGRNDVVIVDVREKTAFNYRHITGAVNVPFAELDTREFDKNKMIILYCERGATSLKGAMILAKKGYDVKSVVGGISAYRASFFS